MVKTSNQIKLTCFQMGLHKHMGPKNLEFKTLLHKSYINTKN